MAMSESKPKQCTGGCGAMVYFDRNSPTGHPSPDKWVPLEIKEGRRTDVAHNCPKRNGSSSGTLDTTATTTAATMMRQNRPEQDYGLDCFGHECEYTESLPSTSDSNAYQELWTCISCGHAKVIYGLTHGIPIIMIRSNRSRRMLSSS
jgi:hypothetical protein